MDSLEKMDKFLKMYNFLNLNQEETEKHEQVNTTKEMESVIKKKKKISPNTKIQDQRASQLNSTKHL